MAFYERWQSERYSIGCKVWEARCPNCYELVESAEPISSNYRFCPYCGFDMKTNSQQIADRRQFTECLMKLKEVKRLLKSATGIIKDVDCNEDYLCDECEYRAKCDGGFSFYWRYVDEALSLLGDEDNEH